MREERSFHFHFQSELFSNLFEEFHLVDQISKIDVGESIDEFKRSDHFFSSADLHHLLSHLHPPRPESGRGRPPHGQERGPGTVLTHLYRREATVTMAEQVKPTIQTSHSAL